MTKQKGFSLIELLLVVVVIGIIAAIAIPNVLASRRSENEASAISSLRTLHSAQLAYRSTVGQGSYAATLAALADHNLIDPTLASGTKDGYEYVVTANPASAAEPASFSFSTTPISTSGLGQTGARTFCIRTEGAIRYDSGSGQLGDQLTYAECVDDQPGVYALGD